MFENLTDRLSDTLKKITGQGRLTEENIKETLREVRMALLEADVALSVVNDFLDNVKAGALGQEVQSSLTPGQAMVKLVHQELVNVMGSASTGLSFRTQPPAIILMAGLQGAGKTTTVAKLGRWLKETQKKKKSAWSASIFTVPPRLNNYKP
ncbi:signal recognition particle receptor subunit alpha [Methylocucumis oryzae]|uniref:signal recognition particle receptor subunit alpha n=1 Tax=Methylocucumis oryzae TaxID=1632867 RepID=UPI000AA3C313|nr:signal recognition particle receptor subunit alpha [Methylocucumis oryzae]